jgi:gliding motility-associated-like protein
LDTSDEFEPRFRFPEGVDGDYDVTLTVVDPATGCMDVYSDVISVKPELLLFIPNAFTPDGDGLNDLWGPVVQNIDENDYRLTIFNRAGEIVFSTRDVNQKWNGGMNGGEYYVQNGIYAWMIETKNSLTLQEITLRGHVSVIR